MWNLLLLGDRVSGKGRKLGTQEKEDLLRADAAPEKRRVSAFCRVFDSLGSSVFYLSAHRESILFVDGHHGSRKDCGVWVKIRFFGKKEGRNEFIGKDQRKNGAAGFDNL